MIDGIDGLAASMPIVLTRQPQFQPNTGLNAD